VTNDHTAADVAESRAHVIAALVRAEGISVEDAARALDGGCAKVMVDGREYTIGPDGAVATPTVLPWTDVPWCPYTRG
jgi:hypothetical protein